MRIDEFPYVRKFDLLGNRAGALAVKLAVGAVLGGGFVAASGLLYMPAVEAVRQGQPLMITWILLPIALVGNLAAAVFSQVLRWDVRDDWNPFKNIDREEVKSYGVLSLLYWLPTHGLLYISWAISQMPYSEGITLEPEFQPALFNQSVMAPLFVGPVNFLMTRIIVFKEGLYEIVQKARTILPKVALIAIFLWTPSMYAQLQTENEVWRYTLFTGTFFIWNLIYMGLMKNGQES